MPEIDMLAYAVETRGEPEFAQRAAPEEAERYAGRVPERLRRFWVEHGRGAYADGALWICDPAPFQPVLDAIFRDDPELDPADMSVVGYTAFGSLDVWHRRRRVVNINVDTAQVFVVPERSWHDPTTGLPFSEDYSVGIQVTSYLDVPLQYDADGADVLSQVIGRQGFLAPGEIYGLVPALQLGGTCSAANRCRVQAVPYLETIAQLSRFTLVTLTPPEPPAHPYGRNEVVRYLGRPT